MKAYDMSRYQRVIGSDGRVSGTWKVLGGVGRDPQRLIVVPIDVVIYDAGRNFGSIFTSGDFMATVADGVVKLSGPHNENKMADIDDAREEFDATLRLVADAYLAGMEGKTA